MTLRCRKGDMAIVIRSASGERLGHIVDVLDFIGDYGGQKDTWEISHRDTPVPSGYKFWYAPDSHLLPIRPGDLDETEETEKELQVAK